MSDDLKLGKSLLEQAGVTFSETGFFVHGPNTLINNIASFLEVVLDDYSQLTSKDKQQIVEQFKDNLKTKMIKE